jgi:glycosyltransferase involved in cell wall biosynthesis
MLSVIIPVYKVENTLDRCVKSVISQDVEDMEVILVDDGSPDSCPEMCDEWVRRDERIRVIHKENGGLSDARNAGIEESKGDVITFVDSDDEVYAYGMGTDDSSFAPLDKYEPLYGCTDIQYKNPETGIYESL